MYVPIVVEQSERGERSYDIYSRLLRIALSSSVVLSMIMWLMRLLRKCYS